MGERPALSQRVGAELRRVIAHRVRVRPASLPLMAAAIVLAGAMIGSAIPRLGAELRALGAVPVLSREFQGEETSPERLTSALRLLTAQARHDAGRAAEQARLQTFLAYRSDAGETRAALVDQAARGLQIAVSRAPLAGRAWLHLAQMRLEQGRDVESAAAALRLSLWFAPHDRSYAAFRIALGLALGEALDEEARALLRRDVDMLAVDERAGHPALIALGATRDGRRLLYDAFRGQPDMLRRLDRGIAAAQSRARSPEDGPASVEDASDRVADTRAAETRTADKRDESAPTDDETEQSNDAEGAVPDDGAEPAEAPNADEQPDTDQEPREDGSASAKEAEDEEDRDTDRRGLRTDPL